VQGGGNSAHEPGAETLRGQGKKGPLNVCERGAGRTDRERSAMSKATAAINGKAICERGFPGYHRRNWMPGDRGIGDLAQVWGV